MLRKIANTMVDCAEDTKNFEKKKYQVNTKEKQKTRAKIRCSQN